MEDNAAGDLVKQKLYVDGRLASGATALTSVVLGSPGVTTKFRIGANSDGGGPFTGQIDAVFVTTSILTPADVMKLYAKGSQSLGASPKNPGDHVEAMRATDLLCVFDSLEPQHAVDLAVN